MNRRALGSGLVAVSAAAASAGAPPQPPRPVQAARHRAIAPTSAAYCHAHEVSGASRWLFISGQVPEDEQGRVPPDFRAQCRLAWANVQARLDAAGYALDDLVKVTIFLSDRRYRGENAQVREEVLGLRMPALTIIITGIYDEAWLLEIEAVAAA